MTRPPRSLVALIAGITVIPLTALLWLGWRLLDQDRKLESQGLQDRLERSADLVAAALQRAIASSEERPADSLPEGAVALAFREGRVDADPPGRIAYLPIVPKLREAPASAFAEGEDFEFRRHDRSGAIRVFSGLANSSDPAVRAGALLRLARNWKNEGRIGEALETYHRLALLDGVVVGGVPAGLVARYARCELFAEQTRGPELRKEAEDLANALHAARWPLTGPVYWLYAADAEKWSAETPHRSVLAETFAEAAATLWADRNRMQGSGRESRFANGQPLSILWRNSGGTLRILIAAPPFVESQWLAAAAPIVRQQHVRLTLGASPGGTPKAARSLADTSLPWSIFVTPEDLAIADRDFVLRRHLLIAGFVLLVSMAVAASYLIFRAVSRELAVARIQSDFVAAVSHEFRTPLTSLRQFTDILRGHDNLADERRRICYEAQSRATDRLTRLVESLLDFGRMEAGARIYHFERSDCRELVERAVEDFRAGGHEIELNAASAAEADVDGEALSRAVWNLLENAVKYSPEDPTVAVALERQNGSVRISVRDRGIGIPIEEQKAIFSKFRRGEEARKRGIKGTGIGLAMVDQIVKAHHGRVELESQPGQGSTFTIVLPAKDS